MTISSKPKTQKKKKKWRRRRKEYLLSLSLSRQNNERGCDDGFVDVKSVEVLGIVEKGLFYLAGATQMISLWIFITSRQPVFVAAMAVSLLACLIREPNLSLTPFPRFQITLSLLCVCVCFGLKPSRSGFYFFYLSYLVTEKMINILTEVEIILCFALLLHFLIFFTVYLIVFACDFWIGIRTSHYYLHFSFINQR